MIMHVVLSVHGRLAIYLNIYRSGPKTGSGSRNVSLGKRKKGKKTKSVLIQGGGIDGGFSEEIGLIHGLGSWNLDGLSQNI